jgi:hypothetical protein
MKYKFSKFDEMVRQQAECHRFLHPIQLLQEGVYGKSYLEEGSRYLSQNEGDLAEEFAARLYGAAIDRQAGHDLLLKSGKTVEVRFRRLYPDSSSSGYQTCVDKLHTKTADTLFILIYNPITEALDGFEYGQKEYGERVTIRWSCRDSNYTEYGGKRSQIGLPSPKEVFNQSRTKPVYDITKFTYEDIVKELVSRGISVSGQSEEV